TTLFRSQLRRPPQRGDHFINRRVPRDPLDLRQQIGQLSDLATARSSQRLSALVNNDLHRGQLRADRQQRHVVSALQPPVGDFAVLSHPHCSPHHQDRFIHRGRRPVHRRTSHLTPQ